MNPTIRLFSMNDLITSLKIELSLDKIILKHPVQDNNKDIDIIISKKDFDNLCLSDNFYLLKNRFLCDKHVFYIFYHKGNLHLIDFNIDGLFVNGQLLFKLDQINKNLVYEKIELIYKNKELRKSLIAGGLKNAKKYSLDRYVMKLNEAYGANSI